MKKKSTIKKKTRVGPPSLLELRRASKKSIHTAITKKGIKTRAKNARKNRKIEKKTPPRLEKFAGNPIMEPDEGHHWESKATFNPGALYHGGRIHLLYRAIGDKDISVIGYASSADGLGIDERSRELAYVEEQFLKDIDATTQPRADWPSNGMYVSGGGGWGGAEDPRVTFMDNRVYMLYVSFNGWSPPGVAITSISLDDFMHRRWNWTKRKLISQPPEILRNNPKFKDVVDKNACLLSEKINGKYVIFHRIFPDILVDFVDNLDFDDSYLEGKYKISPRPGYWDSRKVGVGAPPIKTKDGWLLIYQAVGEDDSSRYKMGAMLLDLRNPVKVLYRSNAPILEPNEWYENNGWKGGVVYPCGAVVMKGELFVYYGGADSVVCVATANLKEFVEELKRTSLPKLVQKLSSDKHAR